MRLRLFPVALISLVVVVTLVLCEVVGHAGSLAPDPAAAIWFCINGKETISCWKKDDEHYYAFLPSYADLNKTTVLLPDGQDVVWGGMPLTQGMRCSALEVAKERELVIGGRAGGTLTIMQSANVALTKTKEVLQTWRFASIRHGVTLTTAAAVTIRSRGMGTPRGN